MKLKPRSSHGGSLTQTPSGWILKIPAGNARQYRLAQLDDQLGVRRSEYAWRPPITVTLRARASSAAIPGTWGFGLWNDPYGFTLGGGDTFLRLPALPQAAWFFGASPRSYLSFRDDSPAHGLMAQVFRSPRQSLSLVSAALTFPFAAKAARRIMSHIISEDTVLVEQDPTIWHEYEVRWTERQTKFRIDGRLHFESQLSPLKPLGFVVWVDNQYAAFDPAGRIRWGMEASTAEVWLEVEDLSLETT